MKTLNICIALASVTFYQSAVYADSMIPALWTNNPCAKDFFQGTYSVEDETNTYGAPDLAFPLAVYLSPISKVKLGTPVVLEQKGCDAVKVTQNGKANLVDIQKGTSITEKDVRWSPDGKQMFIGINTTSYAVYTKDAAENIGLKLIGRKVIYQMFGNAYKETLIGEFLFRKM